MKGGEITKSLKKIVALLTIVLIAVTMSISCFAEGTAPTGMDTALIAVKDDGLAAIAVVAPIAITIFGAFLVWRYGVKFFKGLAK